MNKNNDAFTLIEFLVAIVIAVIIISIAIPAYRDYTNRTIVTFNQIKSS
jgi:prepilin-type N-terminal cleavage/methylation domain-containing protein